MKEKPINSIARPFAETSSPGGPEVEFREFVFSKGDFARVKELIYRHAGISLGPAKKDMVYNRLVRRLRARGMLSFGDYIRILESGDRPEWEAFVNALTTNLTSFFREPHHFHILAGQMRNHEPGRPFTIWSCAASSGEEPFSIAMTAVEHFGSFAPPVRILATDIDTAILEKARRGIYRLDQLKQLTPAQLKRFFLRGDGKNEGLVRIRPELLRLVTFRHLNLLASPWPFDGYFDAIFCRNVMIYFDKPTQYEILKRFVSRLHPGGHLFAGHSESFYHAGGLFRLCGKTVYAPRIPRSAIGSSG